MSDYKVSQLLDVIKKQNAGLEQLIAERDRLRTELEAFVAWANGDLDALACLQRAYSDPSVSEANRIKAASAAIGYERSKPASVVVQVDFRERVRNTRLRQLELDRQEWARTQPKLDLDAPTPPAILGRAEGHESSIQFATKRDGALVPEAEDEAWSPDPAA